MIAIQIQVSIVSEDDYSSYKSVIQQVVGTAHITGEHTFCNKPNNPMKNGFILR